MRQKRTYVLAVLTLTYAINFVDRQIIVILQEPIKRDLQLSDTQLGLLTGFAFVLLYILMGIPLARLADRGVRKNILALALSIWSIFTVLCGFAQNFTQLALARAGVGAGEAACNPTSHSMIADLYPVERRATALSIYSTGINLGVLAGLLIGGWFNEWFGWRLAFIVAGVLGVLLALLIHFTVKEPRRELHANMKEGSLSATISLVDAIRLFLAIPSLRYIALASVTYSMVSYAHLIWYAPHILRNFDISTGALGTWLAIISGIIGGVGTLLSGWLCDRFARRSVYVYLLIPALAIAVTMPFLTLALFVESIWWSLFYKAFVSFLATVYIAPGLALIHRMIDSRGRALASAVIIFVVNLFGLGAGTVFIGALSDWFVPQYGAASLAYAMAVLLLIAGFATLLAYWRAAVYLKVDLSGLSQ